jgi:hypothetical protein
MARLTYQQRKRLPPSAYALPQGTPQRRARTAVKTKAKSEQPKGSFPVTDAAHARNALARAHQLGRKGGPIDQAVHRKVGQKFPGLLRRHLQNAHGRGK